MAFMRTKMLGSLEVSAVGLGCNNFGGRIDAARTAAVVNAAIDNGITLFDTADVYGGAGKSEEFLGQALGSRRDDVLIATKFGMPMGPEGHAGASRRWIEQAVEDSLRRLGTDRIDLYQLKGGRKVVVPTAGMDSPRSCASRARPLTFAVLPWSVPMPSVV